MPKTILRRDGVKFCNACGRALNKKLNKRMRYDEASGYCNQKCQKAQKREDRPKNRKKYGATGYIYG